MSYLFLKSVHMIAAVITIAGFVLRGYWMMVRSDRLQKKLVRIAPPIVDTVFLLSGIALVVVLHLDVFKAPWLLAKFAGLVAYIVVGAIAIKRGSTLQIRIVAFVVALALFAYIVGVAMTKSPASWLTVLAS